jgi:hypothetical protein
VSCVNIVCVTELPIRAVSCVNIARKVSSYHFNEMVSVLYLCPILPVSLDFPFLIAPSVFSNVDFNVNTTPSDAIHTYIEHYKI